MQRWTRIGDFALTDDIADAEAMRGSRSHTMLSLIREDSLEIQDLRRFLWELGHFDVHRMNHHEVLSKLEHCIRTGRVGVLSWARMREILFTPRKSDAGTARDVERSAGTGGSAQPPAPPRENKPPSPPRRVEPSSPPPVSPRHVEPRPRPRIEVPAPKVEPVRTSPVKASSASPTIPENWADELDATPPSLTPREAPLVQAPKVATASSGMPPANYDFLTDKFIDPENQAQLDHNKAVDIEDLVKSEAPKFKMRDQNLVENARREYETNAVNRVIDYHEFLAIRAYSDDLYRGINPALRSGNPGKWSELVASADSGLAKLANHPEFSHSGPVTRGMDLEDDDAVARLFPDGGTFGDKALISSSYDSTKAFGLNVQVSIETINPQAKIGSISIYGDAEAEVLFKTGRQFDVVGKEQLAEGRWKIHLKEKNV